jgi:putative oxidoreductase
MLDFQKLGTTRAPAATILIRLLVGGIFLSEGIQKFLFPEILGSGRFEKIGIPMSHFFGPFVGACELVGGILLLAGLLTRLASAMLLISMTVAIISTKLPVLVGHPIWGFSLPKLQQYGFWSTLHEARADFSMILCLLFLLVVGAGPRSADARLFGPTGAR